MICSSDEAQCGTKEQERFLSKETLRLYQGFPPFHTSTPGGTFAAAKQYMKTLNQLIVKCGP